MFCCLQRPPFSAVLRTGLCIASLLLSYTTPATAALNSNECFEKLRKGKPEVGQGCHEALCGPLETAEAELPFLERLAPACRAQMEAYRDTSATQGTAILHANATGSRKCATSPLANRATNPVVIATPFTQPFVMCTIPKAGCTNFRKLFNVLLTLPATPPQKKWAQKSLGHKSRYSTVFHYELDAASHDDRRPHFILGRNPCAPAMTVCRCMRALQLARLHCGLEAGPTTRRTMLL